MKNSYLILSCFPPLLFPGESNLTAIKNTPCEPPESREQSRAPLRKGLAAACQRGAPCRFTHALACACVLLAGSACIAARGADSGQGNPALQARSQDSLGAIFTQIKQSEYDIHWQPEFGAYMAPNRAHNLRFTFLDDGLTITPRQLASNQSPWSATFYLDSYGRSASATRQIGPGSWTVAKNAAQDDTGGVTIDYKNDASGLRQDFVIKDRPPGAGPLRLDFGVKQRVQD